MFRPYIAHFTQVSIKIIQEGSRSFEFGEAAFSFLCSITKIVKDDIAEILPTIVSAALETVKSEKGIESAEEKKQNFEKDEEDDDEEA